MANFNDLLNSPLPSTNNGSEPYVESGEDDFEKELNEATKDFDESDDFDDFDDIDSDDIDDDLDDDEDDIEDELDELEDDMEDELEGEEPDGLGEPDIQPAEIVAAVDPAPGYDDSPAGELSKEDEERADQMMAAAAGPIILQEACTMEELNEFIESGESEIAINEGLIMESDINDMLAELSDAELVEESVFASNGQKYKMTKKARFNQLYAMSLNIEARAHHDPLFPKMMKAYKIERTIKKKWRAKYGARAKKRALRYLKKLMHSKSKILATAGKRMGVK